MHGVLVERPFIFIVGGFAAPSLQVVPGVIELHHGRGFGAAFGLRVARFLIAVDGPGPLNDPDVILGIDIDSRDLAEYPLLWHLWPEGVDLESRGCALLREDG